MERSENQAERWRALMVDAQQGDAKGYGQLLEELAVYCRKILSSKNIQGDFLEDIVQEILLSTHKFRHTYDQDRPFKPWFHAIINSRISDFFRKHSQKVSREVEVGEDDFLFLEAEQEISSFDVENLQKAFDQLSDQQREIVILLKIDGLTVAQAAEKLNISESAVKVAAHRGYKKIFEVLR